MMSNESDIGQTCEEVNLVFNYSYHLKAGSSGFQMVISRMFFGSGIQMAFESRSEDFSH
jgi:hypothetical protein